MIFTDMGTKVTWHWCPLALANGIEWSILRKNKKDTFNCLYRKSVINKTLWYMGVLIGFIITPSWINIKGCHTDEQSSIHKQ